MLVKTYVRPIGNDFLDKCSPGSFWLTEASLMRDFPDTKEIKYYNDFDFEFYCQQNKVDLDDVTIYG